MKNLSENAVLVLSVVYFVVLITLWCGWVMNLINVIHTMSDPVTGIFIARVIGVLALPLGGVLGFL